MRPWRRAEVWLATRPTSELRPDGAGFLKRRNALGHLACLSTTWRPERFLVLPEEPWFRREIALYRGFHGACAEVRGPGLLWLPRLPGERLDRAVARLPQREALHVAGAALRQLAALHERGPTTDERKAADKREATDEKGVPTATEGRGVPTAGGEELFSHGDATAKNVLHDPASGRFSFFDFETIHPPSFSLLERRADDIATLAGSLALALGPWSCEPLARLATQAHGGALREALVAAVAARDLASRARVPMDDALHARWLAAMR